MHLLFPSVQKTSWQLQSNQQLQITEVDSVSIDEVIRLLQEIKDLGESGKETVSKAKSTVKKAKSVAKKVKRAPSAYNKYMAKTLKELKKKHPRSNHQVLFKRAAKSWKRSAERKRSLK